MEPLTIACRYHFSTEELRRGLRASRAASGRQWWPLALIVFSVVVLALNTRNLQDLLVLLGIAVVGCLAYFWLIRRAIRNSPWRDQDVAYALDQTGYTFEAPSIRSRVEWLRVTNARELSSGFIFFMGQRKRIYIWLPKHGFSSPEDIDHCRTLLQEHIKDFRRL
jgi:hypothetical protein